MASLNLTIVLLMFLAPITVRSELELSRERVTAHYTIRGKLVEQVFNSTGHLEDCLVYGDRHLSEAALELTPPENQFMVDEDNFQAMVLTCNQLDSSRMQQHSRKKRQFYPGTKWCGDGKLEKHYDDLGVERDADICCRAHDHCPRSGSQRGILSGETKFGLTNEGKYFVSTCKCDYAFRDCLRGVRRIAADIIGQIFFNIVDNQCFTSKQTCTAGWWFVPKKCTKSGYRLTREIVY